MDPVSIAKTTSTAINTAKDVQNTVNVIKAATAKTSAIRLTKDQVFQFPLIMDADINDDEKFPMIKSIEKNYASLMMIAITNEGVVDRDKYDNINNFLRKFHNNDDIPFDALESDVNVAEAIASEGYLPNKDLLDMWDCIEEQLDSESINNMYLPFKRTEAKLTRAVEAAKLSVAIEAETDKFFRRYEYNNGKVVLDRNGNPKVEYIKANDQKAYSDNVSKYGEPKTMAEWTASGDYKELSKARGKISEGEMVKDDKFNSLTPTIVRMTISNIKKGSGAPWSQELLIGVRAMPRLLPQSILISNMVEAFKERIIFKFIKWTKGEIKFADTLFGFSAAREDAATKGDRRWLKVLRKRAKRNGKFRFGGMKLNPNTTIIITDADAHMIQDKCGINPRDVSNVIKMMDKYFLLGFGIYDTEAKMLNIIYDGETEFTTYSMRSMIAESKKDANLLSMSKY